MEKLTGWITPTNAGFVALIGLMVGVVAFIASLEYKKGVLHWTAMAVFIVAGLVGFRAAAMFVDGFLYRVSGGSPNVSTALQLAVVCAIITILLLIRACYPPRSWGKAAWAIIPLALFVALAIWA